MLLSSTSSLENKKITHYHGLVTGESLIGANVYKDLFSGVRDVVAGRTSAAPRITTTLRREGRPITTLEEQWEIPF